MSTATKVGLGLGAAAVAALGTRSYLRTQVQDKKRAQLRAAEPVISDMLLQIDYYTSEMKTADSQNLYTNELSSLASYKALIRDTIARIEAAVTNHADTTLLEAEIRSQITECSKLIERIRIRIRETPIAPGNNSTLMEKTTALLKNVGLALAALGAGTLLYKSGYAPHVAGAALLTTFSVADALRDQEIKRACGVECRGNNQQNESTRACETLCVARHRPVIPVIPSYNRFGRSFYKS